MSSFLKSFKELTQPTTLRALLHSSLSGVDRERSFSKIHASALTNEDTPYCPREIILREAVNAPLQNRPISTCLRYTFDLGDAIHDMLRERWLGDAAVGDWECTHCQTMHSFMKRPDYCGNCGGKHFKYEEVRFVSAATGADGGIDVLAKIPSQDKLVAIEIKSMDKDEFRDLKFPKGEHRIRTQLYLNIIAESDHPEKHQVQTDYAYVLYCVKGYGFKDGELAEDGVTETMTPFKSFEIPRNDEAVAIYRGKALTVKQSRETKTIPSGICDAINCKRAKKCPMASNCFSNNYPAGASYA